MLTLILRAIIIYVIVLFSVRIMGKRQIGDMQPFELVATLIIADLACVPMSDVSIPIFYGVVPLLSLVVLHHIFTLINCKSVFFRKLFNGKPIIVIDKNSIDYKALKLLNMTLNDLTEGLRANGCFDISDVEYAIVETNGNISVLLKSCATAVTSEDMRIQKGESVLSVILINDGRLLHENLDYIGISEKKILGVLGQRKIETKDVLILSINQNGECFLQEKKGKSESFEIKIEGKNEA